MRPITVTVGPLTAGSANNIALSQTPGAAGNLTLNGALVVGGVAVLDNSRRILITTADTTHIFTITGLSSTGTALSESFLIVAGSSYSALDYAKVTSVSINGAATGAVTVGTNGIASTAWVYFDPWALPQVAIQCNVTGTVSYTIQQTMDDPNSPTNPVLPQNVNWVSTSDTNGVNATGNIQSNYAYAPVFARVLLNSSTAGTVVATFVQLGVAPY